MSQTNNMKRILSLFVAALACGLLVPLVRAQGVVVSTGPAAAALATGAFGPNDFAVSLTADQAERSFTASVHSNLPPSTLDSTVTAQCAFRVTGADSTTALYSSNVASFTAQGVDTTVSGLMDFTLSPGWTVDAGAYPGATLVDGKVVVPVQITGLGGGQMQTKTIKVVPAGH